MRFRASRGRLLLELRVQRMGPDLHILLSGGDAHIGAVALAAPGHTDFPPLCLPGHKEHGPAARIARFLAQRLSCTVSVAAGIHFDRISAEEITAVEQMADQLAERCAAACAGCATAAPLPDQLKDIKE